MRRAFLFAVVAAAAGRTPSIRITNSVHGECDISSSSSGLQCWMHGTSFALRYFQDSSLTYTPVFLHVGWDGGRSYYHQVERAALTGNGKSRRARVRGMGASMGVACYLRATAYPCARLSRYSTTYLGVIFVYKRYLKNCHPYAVTLESVIGPRGAQVK